MHLSRAGYRTILIERSQLGGQAAQVDQIENYPGFNKPISGKKLMARFVSHAHKWGLKTIKAEALGLQQQSGRWNILLSNGRQLVSIGVILSTGESFDGLNTASYDYFLGKGVGNAPFSNAIHVKGKDVAVIGGGEAAAHQAVHLAKHARKVYLITRGESIKCHKLLARRVANTKNIIPNSNCVATRFEGNSRLNSIILTDRDSQTVRRLKLNHAFVLIGKSACAKKLLRFAKYPGIFVGGDCSGSGQRQIAIASGDGIRAAMNCIAHLNKQQLC